MCMRQLVDLCYLKILRISLDLIPLNLSAADQKNARCGAMLTCHILLKLFDANAEINQSRNNAGNYSHFKSTPEHSLLVGSFHHLSFELLFYVLKLLILIANSGTFLNIPCRKHILALNLLVYSSKHHA